MAQFWEDADMNPDVNPDDYEVDNQLIRDMGLKYQGRDENGNKKWADSEGHVFDADQLKKHYKDDQSVDDDNSYLPSRQKSSVDDNLYNYGNENSNPFNNPFGPQNITSSNSVYQPSNVSSTTSPFNQSPFGFPANPAILQSTITVTNPHPALNSKSKVINTRPALSSRYLVTNTTPALGSSDVFTNSAFANKPQQQQQESTQEFETHFIEEITGKYLGKAGDGYKDPQSKEKITFRKLQVNIRAIPKEDWFNIPRDYSRVSNSLVFDREKIMSDFREVVKRNKDAEPVDTRKDPNEVDKNVEQCLVIIHDFTHLTLTSIILPDKNNTITATGKSVDSFKLVVASIDGNWLIPTDEWDDALKNGPHQYYNDARRARLIVIGFSHTHPEVNISGRMQKSYNVMNHSTEDFNISKKRKLPDIIITVSITVNRNGVKQSIVDLDLLTKDALVPNDVKKLPSLNEFVNNIDYNIFNYIIKNYNDHIGK